jgi:hypothetical protein
MPIKVLKKNKPKNISIGAFKLTAVKSCDTATEKQGHWCPCFSGIP